MKKLNKFDERFLDADWYGITKEITIIGCGALGNRLALELVNIGHTVTVYDFDKVDIHNVKPQGFKESQIGQYKVNALRDLVLDYGGDIRLLDTYNIAWKGQDISHSDIVICAADSMKTNKLLWEYFLDNSSIELFIDARLLAEWYQCFIIPKVSLKEQYKTYESLKEFYESYLLTDAEIPDPSCTYKSTRYAAQRCQSDLIGAINHYLTQTKDNDNQSIEISKFWVWDGRSNYFF